SKRRVVSDSPAFLNAITKAEAGPISQRLRALAQLVRPSDSERNRRQKPRRENREKELLASRSRGDRRFEQQRSRQSQALWSLLTLSLRSSNTLARSAPQTKGSPRPVK